MLFQMRTSRLTLTHRKVMMINYKNLDPYDMRQEPIIINRKFEHEKRKLRELYKLLKAGLISPRDVSSREKRLLRIYYGMDSRQH